MDPVFAWIEQTPLSVFIREDFYFFFVVLIFHALGMALLVGGGLLIGFRTAGLASHAPLHKFRGFFPVMWLGLTLAVISGVLLLISYPAKALTNPVFAVKFICLIGAGLMVREIARRFFPMAAEGQELPPSARWFGIATLALWVAGVTAGKFLPYTHHVLLMS
jgi:hypothetical protein